MAVFVLSARLTESRRAIWTALTQEIGEPRFVAPGDSLPDVGGLRRHRDRRAAATPAARVPRCAEGGGGAGRRARGHRPRARRARRLLGGSARRDRRPRAACPASTTPASPRPTPTSRRGSSRSSRWWTASCRLTPLADGKVIVDVSVALRDLAAVVETRRGAGRVVACGLGNTDAALRTPELSQLLGARAPAGSALLRPAHRRRHRGIRAARQHGLPPRARSDAHRRHRAGGHRRPQPGAPEGSRDRLPRRAHLRLG